LSKFYDDHSQRSKQYMIFYWFTWEYQDMYNLLQMDYFETSLLFHSWFHVWNYCFRLLTNEVMTLFKMKGNKGKHAFLHTAIFEVIRGRLFCKYITPQKHLLLAMVNSLLSKFSLTRPVIYYLCIHNFIWLLNCVLIETQKIVFKFR